MLWAYPVHGQLMALLFVKVYKPFLKWFATDAHKTKTNWK